MARVELAPQILDDFDRLFAHMARFEVEDAQARITEIAQAIQILTHSPLIGCQIKNGRRVLAIGRGSHRTIALYRLVAGIDTVFVAAMRGQHGF